MSGGFAIYFDAASGHIRNLDCFVAVPSGEGVPFMEVEVPFWGELVPYWAGPASFGVPGLVAGLDALWRAHGRLPWARLASRPCGWRERASRYPRPTQIASSRSSPSTR